MRVTIIPDDKTVIIDGQARLGLTFQVDASVHAVQWYDTYGEVEYKTRLENGLIVKPDNQIITDLTPYQSAIDAWNAWTPPAPPEPLPTSVVTAKQARLVLLQDGLLNQVEQLVAAQGGAIQITWEYSTLIERDSELTQAIAAELGLNAEQIQNMFDRAALL